MILDFSKDTGVKYSIKCVNNSAASWYFYIYQRMLNQADSGIYSMAWMASPYKLSVQSYITFTWSADYSFFWFDTGALQPNVIPFAGGIQDAALPLANYTAFDVKNDTPQLAVPTGSDVQDQFSILPGADIPNGVFSTGIGMSGFATFVQQSFINVMQSFGTNASFWVAASTNQVNVNQVLVQTDSLNSISFSFPSNIYSLTAVLQANNTWILQ